jgi:Flp pilus assembly protein TadG
MLNHRQRAVSITSFALIGPIFLFIIFGMAEGGRVMFTWLVLTNEAAEAARYGAVHYDRVRDTALQAADVNSFIAYRLDGVLAPAGMVPTPQVVFTSTKSVAVTLSYQVPLVVPIVSQVLPNPFPVSARSVMAAELGGN